MTDATGFLLFLPPVRDFLRNLLARHVRTSMETRHFVGGEEVGPGAAGRPSGRPGGAQGPIIDGEYRDVSETARPDRPGRQGRLPE